LVIVGIIGPPTSAFSASRQFGIYLKDDGGSPLADAGPVPLTKLKRIRWRGTLVLIAKLSPPNALQGANDGKHDK
jgi:hypothetical protein